MVMVSRRFEAFVVIGQNWQLIYLFNIKSTYEKLQKNLAKNSCVKKVVML